jgi:hypothetical protein
MERNQTLGKRIRGRRDLSPVMTANLISPIELDGLLQFAHQLYDRCRERHGDEHEYTKIVREYIRDLEVAERRAN